MFQSTELKNHFETSSVIKLQSAVIAEWNMNIADNILMVGNYRYRPADGVESIYGTLVNSFDINDEGYFYTDATDASVVIDGGYEYNEDDTDNKVPAIFKSKKEKEKLLYSLEDCLYKFRPRSGVNKLRFFSNNFIHYANTSMASRPRYYMPHKNDKFKYWTSYRTEPMYRYDSINLYSPRPEIYDEVTGATISGTADPAIERGIANKRFDGSYLIDDASPFVVYKDSVPANRIIVKMQTNVGSIDLGPFNNESGQYDDPFYGYSNQTTPIRWRIQYLDGVAWNDAIVFDNNSTKSDGTPIVGSDGYVEIAYGLSVPFEYRNIFSYQKTVRSVNELPETAGNGFAYWLKSSDADQGVYHIWISSKNGYDTFIPDFDWHLVEDPVNNISNFVTDLTDPISYLRTIDNKQIFSEFKYIDGIRIVAESMNKAESTFDLIEMSPRLVADLSDKVLEFSVSKTASDLGVSGLPVGQLLASTGSISFFDYDQAFNINNTDSIISKYLSQYIQIKLFEIINDVNSDSYYLPIKVLYSEGFPVVDSNERTVNMELRDLFFYLETSTAPQLFLRDVSLSSAISILLDNIGFTNYVFKRLPEEDESIIDNFFVEPETTVAEVLQNLAISTQSAMFFDEYNNFVIMSKDYMMPSVDDRDTDIILYGSTDFSKDGGYTNKSANQPLANIVEVSSQENKVYNDGSIAYTTRAIQRTQRTIKQASLLESNRTWVYKPSIVWEISPTQKIKTVNNEVSDSSAYSLSAIPLNSDLYDDVPYVENHEVINNTIDFGEGIYYLSRFSGYFYANGEVVRYDAQEFSITVSDLEESNVWISTNQEYQYYVSKLPFNGKIYPTGLIRIYSEPNYETVNGISRLQNGPVAKHGRGQFGTEIVYHYAGLSPTWSDNKYARSCEMESQYLFRYISDNSGNIVVPSVTDGKAGVRSDVAKRLTHTGKIKNFLATYFRSDADALQEYSSRGGSQASALVLTGPSLSVTESPVNFISYMYKPLNNSFKHFGTRLRVAGKIVNNENRTQIPDGIMSYVTVPNDSPDQNVNIGGGSGGLGIMVNPDTNAGYYFEVIALSDTGLEGSDSLNNLVFYKIKKNSAKDTAVPIKLWGANAAILVDNGLFDGQQRLVGANSQSVHDIAIEYQNIGTTRRFYLFLNDKIVGVVDDESPLDIYNNMALFVRGTSTVFFENAYALTLNYSQNTTAQLGLPIGSTFEDSEINANEAFRKYALSGIVQSTYLSSVSSSQPPEYKIYYEEFGTLMREAAYIKARYEKAYPALNARLLPVLDRVKGYTVAGFTAGAYTAEFLVFNATDNILQLDSSSSNYLRIQGITFTQGSTDELSVDDYFVKNSDLISSQFALDKTITGAITNKQNYEDIKFSRITYGRNEFSISSPYIQNYDEANRLMGWLVSKIMKPRKSVGVSIFANPAIQLGDIVEFSYKSSDNINQIGLDGSRFIVYNIEYVRSAEGPSMTLYLSEVS
jgi:hypothetical protein